MNYYSQAMCAMVPSVLQNPSGGNLSYNWSILIKSVKCYKAMELI